MENAGGSERVTANISNKLASLYKCEVSVVSLYGKSTYFELSNQVSYETLSEDKISYFKVAKKLVKRINEIEPDLIIGISIQKLNLFLSICSLFFKKSVNIIASEHIAYGSVTKFQNLIKRLLYSRFSTIAVLTGKDNTMMRRDGFKNVHVITNASSYFPSMDTLKPICSREKIILAVGRLEFQKGFDTLIDVWSGIYKAHPGWKVVICGEGSQQNVLSSKIKELFHNSASCEIIPFTQKITEKFLDTQIFVLSSRFEGLPMVMIEAMCFGIPAVAFDCETGPSEILNIDNGILVENQNKIAMQSELARLINDNQLREKLSENCLIQREKYFIDNIILEWNKILNLV